MEVIDMAKDGTYRGGRRVKAGSKPDALADKIMKGAPAKRMELPDFTEDMTDFDVDDIGDGVELECMDMPSPDDYLSSLQKDGKGNLRSAALRQRYPCHRRRPEPARHSNQAKRTLDGHNHSRDALQ